MEDNFAASGVLLDKLPATQKSLAAVLAARVEAMNAARKQYADALAARSTDANAKLKALEDQAAELSVKIDQRKQQLALNAAPLGEGAGETRNWPFSNKNATFWKKPERPRPRAYNAYFPQYKAQLAAQATGDRPP